MITERYHLIVYHREPRYGSHPVRYHSSNSLQSLRKDFIKRLSKLPADCWGFDERNTIIIQDYETLDVIERVDLRDYARLVCVYIP